MTHLSDLFSLDDLQVALTEKLVIARKHPFLPLTILNYTEICQYERGHWNSVTLQCRGLIHDDNGEIINRPFRKFFNYGQVEGGNFSLTESVCVTDKLDGSLISLGMYNNIPILASRGSFESEQAIHATEIWRKKYSHIIAPTDWTMLFEIIYPTNRIVLDYGDMDDLVLLGMVEIATGRTVGPSGVTAEEWNGPRAEVFAYNTLNEAIRAPERKNAEGLVVHFLDSNERLKIKQADYVELHRIIGGLSERSIWQHLVDGKDINEMLSVVPDEFHGWILTVATGFGNTIENNVKLVEETYSNIISSLPSDYTKKNFALIAKEHPLRSKLFAKFNGKDYWAQLWDDIYPVGHIGPKGTITTDAV